jgi:lysine N6-hydroxylase
MAALCDELPQLECIFFDQSPSFHWHPGMMLPDARLQVPFYADLVTVVNPCSRFSYLNFLKEQKRLFRFAILENNFILRREYNAYCQWVVNQLDSLRFHHKVVDVHYEEEEGCYAVMVHNLSSDAMQFYYGKHLVIGAGSVPSGPHPTSPNGGGAGSVTCSETNDVGPVIFHSADYLFYKEALLKQPSISIIGSGQSAAEIFYDLLQHSDNVKSMYWFTRSERFFPMDYSKFALEMTSPDYIDHFYSLDADKKHEVLRNQSLLYKGINASLIDAIYNLLYEKFYDRSDCKVFMHPNMSLKNIAIKDKGLELEFHHTDLDESFVHTTDAVIMATGYKPSVPEFIQSVKERLGPIPSFPNGEGGASVTSIMDESILKGVRFHVNRNYSIDINASEIFVQHAELHTHGFSAADLGMGPYRNATILNTILGYEHFAMEKQVTFQRFGLPGNAGS